jgi:imidazole glycerol phosphate synthase glutamine amidotransferase subunit
VANLASVLTGLRRAGAIPRLAQRSEEIADADRVVLPGVGAFGTGMRTWKQDGLDAAIRERLTAGRATLAICLGLQLLCTASEEDPTVGGLGFIPGTVRRFPANVRVPQFGWNRIRPATASRYLSAGFAYFANSYCLFEAPPGWSAAFTVYGQTFVSALEKGEILACQFHPELSGPWGRGLLGRWLDGRPEVTRDGPVQLAAEDR